MAVGEPEPERTSRAGRNLSAALIVGIALFAVVVAALFLWPPGVVLLLALLVALGATEVAHALRRVGMNPTVVPVAISAAAIVLSAYVSALTAPSAPLLPAPVGPVLRWGVVGLAVIWCLAWRMTRGAQGYARDAAASVFIVGYLGVLASFVGLIIALPDGQWKLAVAFCCVVGSDTGGYILGATLGKHPMAPKISPKKTWEGMVGSVLLAGAVGIVLTVVVLHLPWWLGLVLALLMVVFGTLGDLVESLIKRDVGIKDMSSVLPGHGGIMERLDSMLFAMPVAYLVFFAYLWWQISAAP